MAEKQVAPYGSWKSPITSDLIVHQSISFGQIVLDREDVYWSEGHPTEGGRNVIVRRTPDGKTSEVTPPGFNVRTRVHEYGGGAYTVKDGTIYFSNFDDQRLYRQDPGQEPRPLTPEVDLRYADAVVDERRERLICVREDHTGEGEAINTIVALDLHGDEKGGRVLVSGNDFYSNPRISPDGSKLAWLTWNHPNMPWDGTELWVGDLQADGSVANAQRVAGGPEESIFQPEWSPDGVLYFVSDRTGWWNLYRLKGEDYEALHEMEAEFGRPQWVFGQSAYSFESPELIICTFVVQAVCHLASLDTRTLAFEEIETPYEQINEVHCMPGKVYFEGASPTEPRSIVELDLGSGQTKVLRRSDNVEMDAGYISVPETIEFPTEGGLTAYGFFYRPKNKDFAARAGEKPPLVVFTHGGPTGNTSNALGWGIQYWTSRGFGVLDVNYGGSTGYGTEFRRRLNGQWGVVDMDDCVNGALYLVERGDVDGDRLAIRGGSAGGYTTINALTFRDVFKAGASYFGISDLEALIRDSHKFEARYEEHMVGPYPERKDLYYERSAIHFTDRLSAPMILFQGLEDKVVPPNQAEMMVEALKKKGLPVAYLAFEGEQHGFRRAENIKRSLDAELYFYSRVFGFPLADEIEPVEIENLA
jgi:dipeptidyl aminopeptidase/acylaminoacyl peptidase